ncbi:MAG: histone deacetylase [Methanomicrobiaceae archaeon]|nr:histone deacetylase [Methanomicrobiaceae archaeon]
MRTGIVYHTDYLLHEQRPKHPERRERIAYTLDLLDEEEIWEEPGIKKIEPRMATEDEVLAAHNEVYFNYLTGIDKKGADIDINTYGPPGFLKGALLSAGGAVCAAEAVFSREVRNAFALVRPPGHHAGRSFGGGFCYLNNVAIMVRAVQNSGYKRVMIIDWDAHHGNGTEDIFYEDPDVLYTSVHQSSLFPGTGPVKDAGYGEGKGLNINMPVPPGSSDNVYRYLMEEVIIPAGEEFRPDFIAISAGQDNHFTDPLTSLALTARGYADMMSEAVALSDKLCNGRLTAVLEGGYGVEGALPYVNLAIIASLAGLDLSGIREPASYEPLLRYEVNDKALEITKKMVSKLKKVHSDYWNFI